MTGRIRILDDALADQIAAGEVVERPASLVKELIENAIDAGATRITVEVEEAGRRRVRVTDDGSGMAREDAALCIRRHATSKIASANDLIAIATLGFRGEALPSIAAVSRFSLVTRVREAVEGTRVEIDGGSEPRIAPAPCAPGTTVEVRDLFYNVPARLKFLKGRAAENGQIALVCTRAALAHPALALVLKSDGRITRELLPVRSLAERARAVFAREPLVEIEADEGAVRLWAMLSPPERARAGAAGLHLLVNGRPVRDLSLARAVAFAYGSVLGPGRYPTGVFALEVPHGEVDVNVHPQKSEVRFANGRALFDTVARLVSKRLGAAAWRPRGYWEERLAPGPSGYAQTLADAPAHASPEPALPDPWGLGGDPLTARVERTPPAAPMIGARGFWSSLRVLGQVHRMLIVCEGDDALHVLDQHAADERVRFDRLRRSYTTGRVKTQRLLFPERVEVTEEEAALADAHRDELARAGLDCARLGPTTIALHAVPALLARAAPERLLRDVLDEAGRTGERAFGEAVDTALATMACHGAIRAGDELSIEEARALVVSLDAVEDFAGHCPHGRPVVHRVPLDEIERRLGR